MSSIACRETNSQAYEDSAELKASTGQSTKLTNGYFPLRVELPHTVRCHTHVSLHVNANMRIRTLV